MDYVFHPSQDNIVPNQLHFIVPGYSSSSDVKNGIKKALKKFGCTSALLSLINMLKNNCITKEKYEEIYKINEQSEERGDLSVGEDLETFLRNIKDGKMNSGMFSYNQDSPFFLASNGGMPNNKRRPPEKSRDLFLICLLDREERKNLIKKMKFT